MRVLLAWGTIGVALLSGCTDSATGFQFAFVELESNVAFGTVRADQTTTQTVMIQKPFVPGGTVVLVEAAGPFAPAPGEFPGTAASGIDFDIKVVFDPAVASLTQNSPRTGFIRLRFTKIDGSLTQTTLISLGADVETPLPPVIDATLDFGGAAVGQTATEFFTVSNPNQATPIEITSATAPGTIFDLPGLVFPITLAPGSSHKLFVDYRPPTVGPHAATATLTATVGGPFATNLRGDGIPGEIVTDLGFIPVSPFGETAWIEISVPPEAISIHWEILADEFLAKFDLNGLEGPGGRVYQNDTLTGPYRGTNVLPGLGLGGALFLQLPNSDHSEVKLVSGGGTYRLRLLDLSGTNPGFHMRVIVEQRHAGRVSNGLLPLNVFIADGIPISAAEAPTNPSLQTTLSTMDAHLATRGLRLGQISYFKLSDPAYDDISSLGEFFLIQTESFVATEDRLNLFFVNSISAFGPGVLGVSGAVPGTKRNGTFWSGVIIAFDGRPSDLLGSTTAHESGHYLGLFHTTQFDNPPLNIIDEDLILDTPVCDLFLSLSCPTLGDSNLMWPFGFPSVAGIQLSRGQSNVMKNHPLVEPGSPPAPPAQLAQRGGAAQLPMHALQAWCANCAGRLRR